MLLHGLLDILQRTVAFKPAIVTTYAFATIFVPAVFSYYVMAVLVQLPRTRFYRAALLPVVFWVTFRASMCLDFSGNDPAYDYLNQALLLGMFFIAMRSTAWVLAQRPYTRLPIFKSGSNTINDRDGDTPTTTEHVTVSVFSAMWNAWDLTVNFRGIGWDEVQKMHVPTPNFQVESRLIFALLTLGQVTILWLVADILSRCVHSFGPDTFGTPRGGTIFDPSLPPLERYMKSSIITLLSGFTSYVTFNGAYQLLAVLFTILFQQFPSQWPPLFDSPWLSTSLISFWGRRWHQVFRECFVAVGGKPLERYLGRPGFVMGAFVLSGVLHVSGTSRGADALSMMVFFVMQGVGVVMEHTWKRATGRRVGGITGWLWTFSWLVLWGHTIVDVWARRGLLGSELSPDDYRPTTLFLNWMSGKNVG